MTALTLFTLGTPHGSWPAFATQVLGTAAGGRLVDPAVSRWHEQVVGAAALDNATAEGLAALARLEIAPAQLDALQALQAGGGQAWGGIDALACWTAERLAERFPEARFLVWVESPAQMLAQWLASGGQGDPQRLLKAWEAAAQRIARLVHKHLTRCLVVLADEAQRHPAALQQRLSRWMGVDLGAGPARTATTAPDPLGTLLAAGLAAGDAASVRAFSGLYASCIPLADGTDAGAALHAVDTAACVEAYRRLVREASTSEALDARLKTLTQEYDLLLVQLHQVQEELERYYLAWQELDAGAAAAADGVAPLRIERVELGSERDTPPHRELGFVLHGVQAGDRLLQRVEARLVEHHGRPGLAFFESEGVPTPLMAWRAEGSEGERAYMLLVPTDEAARRVLQGLGTGDWQFVEGVAAAIARALEAADAAPAARWRVVATRLRRQLAELPERLRFDGLEVVAAKAGVLDADFEQVSFGSRRVARLRLRWRPQATDGTALELLAPEAPGEAPALAAWPVDEGGAWCARWPVPSGSAGQGWRALGRTDRELLLGLLDALPAVAHRAKALGLVDAGAADSLAEAASRPLRLAHRALHGTRLRRVVRALRGRLGA